MTGPSAGQFDVCIVSWRTRELLRACLRAVISQPEAGRIIVVDNASGDGTVEMVHEEFPGVELIANRDNVGYAAANNQAIRAGSSPLVLLLNPDTEVAPGALGTMAEVLLGSREVGAVAPQLVTPQGRIERSCRAFPAPAAVLYDAFGLSRLAPGSARFGAYRMTYWGHDTRREVDQPMASALALKREAVEQMGGFDEAFRLYFNDVDLCYRLKEAGWRIVFEPRAQVVHHHGASTRQVRPEAVLESHRGLIRFYRKHYRGRVSWLGYWAVIALAGVTMYPRAALARLLARR